MSNTRKQVNNIAKLPLADRLKICSLLCDDNLTYENVREEVASMGIGLVPHNASIIAYKQGEEYQEYAQKQKDWQIKILRKAIDNKVIENDPVGSARQEHELMEQIQGLINTVESPKEIKALASALKDLQSMRENRKIQALEKQIEELKILQAQELLKRESEITHLKSLINKNVNRGLTAEALAEIEEKAGLL